MMFIRGTGKMTGKDRAFEQLFTLWIELLYDYSGERESRRRISENCME